MQKISSLLVLVLLLACCGAAAASRREDPSYGDLAAQTIPPLLSKALGLLPTLNATTLPQDVSSLRKAILYAREMLDIFVFSYPNSTNGTDVWRMVRKDLDIGYTLIGDFQDLNHSGVNYTQQELVERRTKCLNWLLQFSNNTLIYDYADFVLAAAHDQLFERSGKVLSQFYWNDAEVRPDPSISGLQNVAYLVNGMLIMAIRRYDSVTALTDITVDETHTLFHNYRKLSRGILSVPQYFPSVFTFNITSKASAPAATAHCDPLDALTQVGNLYSHFGDVNDAVTAYQILVEQKQHKKAAMQRALVLGDWQELRDWLTAVAMPHQFACLLANIVPF
eukprot:gnl/Hemi2/26193_TR8790_c0_g1_i1.p1 gnl/Hemi2/26193_TR8790_c0_g1~~gnl/Hemi2/26193_TR8790_c0_g1_i1.p1  ORF type:complete len:336 (+),score=125.83 gnl/Hemi2/26193_TR8790_c0_g1_i1:138-1145(+)